MAIHLFAIAFLLQALLSFGWEMGHRMAVADDLLARGGLLLDDAGTIVAISARLTIAIIVVALIWLLANPVARWSVTAIAIAKPIINAPQILAAFAVSGSYSWIFTTGHLLTLLAAGLLFTPAARVWFRRKGRHRAPASD